MALLLASEQLSLLISFLPTVHKKVCGTCMALEMIVWCFVPNNHGIAAKCNPQRETHLKANVVAKPEPAVIQPFRLG